MPRKPDIHAPGTVYQILPVMYGGKSMIRHYFSVAGITGMLIWGLVNAMPALCAGAAPAGREVEWKLPGQPPEVVQQLKEFANRLKQRRAGERKTVIMLAGPKTPAKAQAARLIAGQLNLDIYRVDLSAVVSKYIGETEKNLNAILSRAEAREVVLFFDEADALFGKRREAGDFKDRYSNQEVSSLLRKIESYKGVVVIASNEPQRLPLRRVDVSVTLGPSPSFHSLTTQERKQIAPMTP